MRIEEAIQQKSFQSEYLKLNINLLYTASWIATQTKRSLDPYGISWQQFNMLRILRGAKGNPYSLKNISDRMIDRTSNTSRLADKLLVKGLIERVECPEDRRQVNISITSSGMDLCSKASQDIENQIELLYAEISEEDAVVMNQLLDAIRTSEN